MSFFFIVSSFLRYFYYFLLKILLRFKVFVCHRDTFFINKYLAEEKNKEKNTDFVKIFPNFFGGSGFFRNFANAKQ